ncbi:MAG: DUF4250 domain-containing protein [Lachnospiraceae bacterium]|nr:DUF4250 domain-containing protein [Lachnospiraceae bacterium]
MKTIPKDPMILLSFLNTQLRDHYASLEELCRSFDLKAEDLEKQMRSVDYRYDHSLNKFV